MSNLWSRHDLGRLLEERRARELELLSDLTEEQMIGQRMRIVEPPIWEMGHVGWFQEYWILRNLDGTDPMMEKSDALYESSRLYSHQRWDLTFPSRSQTLDYISAILDRCISRLGLGKASPEEAYYYLLSIFHEDMHSETLTFIRQTHGYPTPHLAISDCSKVPLTVDDDFQFQDVEIPGGVFRLGAEMDAEFAFDNEKWAHSVEVQPFWIATTPVTNAQFVEFVEAGGYQIKRLWGKSGKEWLRRSKLEHPIFWHKGEEGTWYQKKFDQLIPLEPYHPVIHVNWYEANAYCNWANRRLPTEAEWELAACGSLPLGGSLGAKRPYPWGFEQPTPDRANMDWWNMGCIDVRALPDGDSLFGCRQMIGNIWEWTADTFNAYPGFTIDPYEDYSLPSFGKKKVLRGGSWATRSLLIRNTWRNFYMPFRNNIFAGFRTCAIK